MNFVSCESKIKRIRGRYVHESTVHIFRPYPSFNDRCNCGLQLWAEASGQPDYVTDLAHFDLAIPTRKDNP